MSAEHTRKRNELLSLLSSMGFPTKYAEQAVAQVDPTLPNAGELCFHWMEEHPWEEVDEEEKAIGPLLEMGFKREESLAAMKRAGSDVQKAIYLILYDKSTALKDAIIREDEQYRTTRGDTDGDPGNTWDEDGFIKGLKQQPNQPHPASSADGDIKTLTAQIMALQDLVLNYQNKYIALKRRAARARIHEEADAAGADGDVDAPEDSHERKRQGAGAHRGAAAAPSRAQQQQQQVQQPKPAAAQPARAQSHQSQQHASPARPVQSAQVQVVAAPRAQQKIVMPAASPQSVAAAAGRQALSVSPVPAAAAAPAPAAAAAAAPVRRSKSKVKPKYRAGTGRPALVPPPEEDEDQDDDNQQQQQQQYDQQYDDGYDEQHRYEYDRYDPHQPPPPNEPYLSAYDLDDSPLLQADDDDVEQDVPEGDDFDEHVDNDHALRRDDGDDDEYAQHSEPVDARSHMHHPNSSNANSVAVASALGASVARKGLAGPSRAGGQFDSLPAPPPSDYMPQSDINLGFVPRGSSASGNAGKPNGASGAAPARGSSGSRPAAAAAVSPQRSPAAPSAALAAVLAANQTGIGPLPVARGASSSVSSPNSASYAQYGDRNRSSSGQPAAAAGGAAGNLSPNISPSMRASSDKPAGVARVSSVGSPNPRAGAVSPDRHAASAAAALISGAASPSPSPSPARGGVVSPGPGSHAAAAAGSPADAISYSFNPATRMVEMVGAGAADSNRPADLLRANSASSALPPNRRMIGLLAENDPAAESKGPRPLKGWVNSGQYRSLHVEIVETLDMAAKLGKTFFCVVRVDSLSYKTKLLFASELAKWTEHLEFPLVDTTQFVTVTVFDNDEDGWVGRCTVPIEVLKQPVDKRWEKMQTVRMSLYDGLRSAAAKTAELSLKIIFSRDAARPSPDLVPIVDEKPTSYITDAIRSKVSKNNVRFQDDGFDLDLSYITERIIATSYPSSAFEGVYRNRMKDVQRFLEKRHYDRFRVYNLCAERAYDPSKFEGNVVRCPIEDHEPCPLQQILPLCIDMHSWLSDHPQNVVLVHCKTGKGRTGMMIACYLLFAKICSTAQEAIHFFSERRTRDSKAVTIPSQIRWVQYVERMLKAVRDGPSGSSNPSADVSLAQIGAKIANVLGLLSIRIHGIPFAVRSANANIWFVITKPGDETFKFSSRKSIKPARFDGNTDAMVFMVPPGKKVVMQEDVKVEFFHGSTMFKKPLFHFWFNTRFVLPDAKNDRNVRLVLTKEEIDGARKDTKHRLFPSGMCVEVLFRSQQELNQPDQVGAPSLFDKIPR